MQAFSWDFPVFAFWFNCVFTKLSLEFESGNGRQQNFKKQELFRNIMTTTLKNGLWRAVIQLLDFSVFLFWFKACIYGALLFDYKSQDGREQH